MSKGIGDFQCSILGYLSHARRALFTSELATSLLPVTNRKQATGQVLRACKSLERRGLVTGERLPDPRNVGRFSLKWKRTKCRFGG